MDLIIRKLYLKDKHNCYKDIINFYNNNGFGVINYLYFANSMKFRLFENRTTETQNDYYNSLNNGNFILPDGIALQVFYYLGSKFDKNLIRTWPQNLNGTDFAPFFLNQIKLQNTNLNINLILYGAKQEIIERAVVYIKNNFGINVLYYQNGYGEFDWEKLQEFSLDNPNNINIFMIGRGTPIQEIWINQNIENIKKHKLLVFSQGGTFDFWGGVEKRAPGILVKLRVFETFWRIITNPKKNLPKFISMFGIFRFFLKLMLKKC